MMIKLNNFRFFKKIFINYLCAMVITLLCFYQKIAFSQNNNPQKELSSNMVSTNIKVSELSKPSLGSLGVNTKANDLLGINIWGNMNAKDIIEHLWKVIISDNSVDQYESNLMRRICGLIYFPDKECAEIKLNLLNKK